MDVTPKLASYPELYKDDANMSLLLTLGNTSYMIGSGPSLLMWFHNYVIRIRNRNVKLVM